MDFQTWYPWDDSSGHGKQVMLALLDKYLLAPHYWCCCQELLHIWSQDKRGVLSAVQLAGDLGCYLETANHSNWQSANMKILSWLSFILRYLKFSCNSKKHNYCAYWFRFRPDSNHQEALIDRQGDKYLGTGHLHYLLLALHCDTVYCNK